jgi:hypothetical protein
MQEDSRDWFLIRLLSNLTYKMTRAVLLREKSGRAGITELAVSRQGGIGSKSGQETPSDVFFESKHTVFRYIGLFHYD